MTTTPRFGATDWAGAQASPWVPHNDAMRRLEAGAGRFAIADRVTAPPGTCADGASYIIIATATGAFAGKEGQIATAVGTNAASGWLYLVLGTIHEGSLAYVQDEDVDYRWDGSAWGTVSGGATEASASEIWTGSETGKYISPDKLFDAAAPQTLTSSSNVTAVNMNLGINFNLSLDEDSEIANPTNVKAGQSGRIRVTDDGTGGWDLTFDTNWNFIGTDPTPITTVASEVHLFAYYANSSSDIEVSYLGALA